MRILTEAHFDAQVLEARVPVLVDFSTTWCGPCRQLTPILHALATEHGASLRVVLVDGDDFPALAARYGVRAFPTVIAFAHGREIARHVGLTKKERLLALLAESSAT